MNAVLGTGFVALGFSASLMAVILGTVAILKKQAKLLRYVRPWAMLVIAAGVGAFIVMEVALFQRDYDLAYVQKVGADKTPAIYNFAALWSSLEGSILLWVLVLVGFLAAMLWKFKDKADDELWHWALLLMLGVCSFFFLLLLGPADPFVVAEVPESFVGPGPNPLLQNHILVAFHPPMLYIGYVGFTVPFVFALAALITGRLGEGWLLATRRWTLVAWGFLTFGIILGAWWSYEVLGWGGFWAWDPVENVSLLPWLTGTAYLHSVIIQERRGLLRVWNLSLACATFLLTIFGTFITRSGVIDSVHAFADGNVGPFLLVFLALASLLTVALIGFRGDILRSSSRVEVPFSREGAFLFNNLLFAAFAFVILLGTVFPLLAELLDGSRLNIGRPYFDSMATPIGLVLLFLMAVATVLPWGKATIETTADRLRFPVLLALFVVGLAVLIFEARGLRSVMAFGLAALVAGASFRVLFLAVRRNGWRGLVGRSGGGMIAHLGVVLLAFGLTASESYKFERSVDVALGETVDVAGHSFTNIGAQVSPTAEELQAMDAEEFELLTRVKVSAQVQIDGGQIYEPALSVYPRGNIGQAISAVIEFANEDETGALLPTQKIPTPSVQVGFTKDIFLTLDRIPSQDGSIGLTVVTRPLVAWLWAGGFVLALGSLLALIPSRKRVSANKTSLTQEVVDVST